MFQIPPTPKQLAKFHNENPPDSQIIPDRWEEWVTQTKILSGGYEINFIPYPYQIKIAQRMRDYSCIFIKSRQCGLSTVTLSVLLHQALKSRGFQALIFSRTQTDSSLLATKAQYALNYCGASLETDSKMDIIIKKAGRLRFLNSNINSPRGADSISSILWDESAFQPFLASLREAASPCMSLVGDKAREYFVSTPSSPDGLYYELCNSGNPEPLKDICEKIVREEYPPFYWFIDSNGFAKIFVWWKSHPDFSKNPRFLLDLHEKKQIPWDVIEREYNLSFQNNDEQYFDQAILNSCKRTNVKKLKGTPGNIYYVGIDPNSGGKDYCSVTVLEDYDSGNLTKIHGYRKNRGTSIQHINEIKLIIERFNIKSSNLYVGVEVNGAGQAWIERLDDERYFGEYQKIFTNKDNKAGMLARCKVLHKQQRLLADKTDTYWQDASNLREIGDQIKAAEGKNSHDDECMSMAIATAIANSKGFK